ncbi:MAG: hypothetical protein JW704_07910 [Anaerolineaceae bacterium]|nr:hypothetical protein [Anaerolineaceae bacterium]MBN2677138.1 hypothetical protein [Anaerolineaceae bacterium]
MNKRIWITCLIILGCACLLTAIVAAVGTGVYIWDQNNPQPTMTSAVSGILQPSSTYCPEEICQETPEAVPTDNGIAVQEPGLSENITKTMDKIQNQVIDIRGLQPNGTVPRALLSEDELRDNVINDFLVDYTHEDALADLATLSVFGLLPQDFDLITFYEDLYSEQIAGYYDDEIKEMYVVRNIDFGGLEKMTYAHEYTHVLQDQNFDFRNGLKINDEDCQLDSERCAAITALIEGDAVLTEYNWFYQYASEQDQSDVDDFYQSYESPIYDSAPEFMKEDFLFPYTAGLEFVQMLYDQGHWQAINNAYANPPVSTEQIMHPSRYPDDSPVVVTLSNISSSLGEGWNLTYNDVVGEWYTYLMLAKGYHENYQLDEEVAHAAAAGWGGDQYQVYTNTELGQSVLIMRTVWDTNRDAKEFLDAFEEYGSKRWGDPVSQTDSQIKWVTIEQTATISYSVSSTLVIISPDVVTMDLVKDSLREY